MSCLGKFEGDPFEKMFVKSSKSSKALEVALLSGPILSFDLSVNAYVYEDLHNPRSIILDYQKNLILFQVNWVSL